MTSFLASYGSEEALQGAQNLNSKAEVISSSGCLDCAELTPPAFTPIWGTPVLI
jgi:hypothetical protein